MTEIREIFERDPTRSLEEVQKVNSRKEAERDVREFHETESARKVLEELGDIVETHRSQNPRFLYVYATFGSGKTHLLKLIGFVLQGESEHASTLAGKWSGFRQLRESVESSSSGSFKPVFLNLLNKDASKEPPLPFLIYQAVGRELGYPTEPGWLLDWCWRLDQESTELWEELNSAENNGKTFDEVVDGKATIRSWLWETVPHLEGVGGTRYSTEEGVKESIEEADDSWDPTEFEPENLSNKIQEARTKLQERDEADELLLGLDEIALFIGDNKRRYWEYRDTVDELVNGPNPPVVGTGQYSLRDIHEEFLDEQPDQDWHTNQVKLEGADTEIIVRKRWLMKNDDYEGEVRGIVDGMPDLDLDKRAEFVETDTDPMESYPFREYDLSLMRTTMQQLMPMGQASEREYVQGRALLVLVRSLFTEFGWSERELGSLVTWDTVFDLLSEETDYISMWVERLVEKDIASNLSETATAVAKTLYLVNNASQVASTPENVARLLVESAEDDLSTKIEEVEEALDELIESNKVLTETSEEGIEEYKLVSEEQETVLDQVKERRGLLSVHRVSAQVENRLLDTGFNEMPAVGSRREIDVGDERLVPISFDTSVLDSVDPDPKPLYDSVRIRLLAAYPDDLEDEVERWQSTNQDREGGEHLLVAVEIPTGVENQLREVIAMEDVLSEETGSFEDLRSELQEDRRKLERRIGETVSEAKIYETAGSETGTHDDLSEVISRKVNEVFGSSRKVLSEGIREAEFAEEMYRFFDGRGGWPLPEEDAEMLGVDIRSAEIDGGWCRSFLDDHSESRQISGEAVLSQTKGRKGSYLGTPVESVSALLITLAAAEEIGLKIDGEYLSEPGTVGRQVSGKTRIEEVQIDFEGIVNGGLREVAMLIAGEGFSPDSSDEISSELRDWLEENSTSVKRTFRGVNRELGRDLLELRAAVEPAFSGEDLDASALTNKEVCQQAEEFDKARDLFDEKDPVWSRSEEAREAMLDLYPDEDEARDMVRVPDDGIPGSDSLEELIQKADNHRVKELRSRYEDITGESTSASDVDEILQELGRWISSEGDRLLSLMEQVEEMFEETGTDDVRFFVEELQSEEPEEEDIVKASQEIELISDARALLGEEGLWSSLEDASERLEREHPQSPTTDDVEEFLEKESLPSEDEARGLLKEAEDPVTLEDLREELEEMIDDLRDEHPESKVTQEAVEVVEGEKTLDEDALKGLVEDAEDLLIDDLTKEIDSLEDGTVVLIDRDKD